MVCILVSFVPNSQTTLKRIDNLLLESTLTELCESTSIFRQGGGTLLYSALNFLPELGNIDSSPVVESRDYIIFYVCIKHPHQFDI